MRITGAQPTPNPDAIKLDLDQPQHEGIRSYRTGVEPAADGQPDPLASALLGIEGVVGVLIHERFITLSREPGRSWTTIRKAADRALLDHSTADHDQA